MNDIVEQVFLQIVATVMFGGAIEYVLENKEENRFLHAIGADFWEIVQIVMALEDKFDINITDEEKEGFAKKSCNEILHMLESAGASAESMQRKQAQKQVKPVVDKKQVQESPKPVADKKQVQESQKSVADKKQVQETPKPVADKKQVQKTPKPVADKKQVQKSPKPVADKKQVQKSPKSVADKKQTQKMEFKNILHQAENLVASIKLFETAQNNITAPSKQQPKPAIELRTMKDGKPYCELLGKKCNRPERPNNTGKVYCEFMNCRIYNNFQRLR